MKRFAYVLDPLCLTACALYAVNRFYLHAHTHSAFLHSYFNDLLLIPAALPLALWVQRRFHLRRDDASPRWTEIGLHLAVWSIAAEVIAPLIFSRATGDTRDLLAYTAGALLAGCWWQRPCRTYA